jgi:hypothetical protein
VSEPDGRGAQRPEPNIIELLVFAPIDAAFNVLGDPKGAAVRGRARVDTALRQARALGELSVRFGAAEFRRRADSSPAPSAGATKSSGDGASQAHRDAGPPPNDVIADYDVLSASQIVPLLAGLDAAERARVATYEAAARNRQTILRKLAQLDDDGG